MLLDMCSWKTCADVQMWEDAEKIQDLRRSTGAFKKLGRAWFEVDKQVHDFLVRGMSTHKQMISSPCLIECAGL